MVIKSNKSYIVYLIGLFTIVFLASCLFAQTICIDAALMLLVCSSVIIALHYIAIGRTIIMDERGCKIVLGRFSKEYAWDEICIKRLEPDHLGLRNSYHLGGAFFSIKRVSKPDWLDPSLYCTLCHPLSCFFVYFVKDDPNSSRVDTPGIYEAEKHSFVEQLQRWGINLV